MYIGAWQEYHLSRTGGSIAGTTGRKAAPSNSLTTPSSSSAALPRKGKDSIDLEDMRAALLLSLDAETTRRYSFVGSYCPLSFLRSPIKIKKKTYIMIVNNHTLNSLVYLRAMAAIEMTRASPTAEEKLMANTNSHNPRRSIQKLVVPKKKPLIK